MTRKEILAMVRKLIADEQATGFTEGGNLEEPEGTQELLNYLDRAVDEYSKRQAGANDVRLMKEVSLTNGADLPEDFLKFCGAIPVKVLGKKVTLYISGTVYARYLARLPYVTNSEYDQKSNGTWPELPYENDQSIAIAALAAIYALNKMEANVSQHLMLLGYGAGTNGTA